MAHKNLIVDKVKTKRDAVTDGNASLTEMRDAASTQSVVFRSRRLIHSDIPEEELHLLKEELSFLKSDTLEQVCFTCFNIINPKTCKAFRY